MRRWSDKLERRNAYGNSWKERVREENRDGGEYAWKRERERERHKGCGEERVRERKKERDRDGSPRRVAVFASARG